MSTLTETLSTLTSDGFDSTKAKFKALNNHNDAYHLQMSIKTYGEQATHIEASRIIAEKENIPFSKAAAKASTLIEHTLDTTEGNKLFKETHLNLQNEG